MAGIAADRADAVPPRSLYGVAKAYGHFPTQNYRESYGMFAVSGILFNHESPRRGAEFVTRKISLGVAKVKLGYELQLRLGNLSARRDWGFAGDYVRAMHLMLGQDEPVDYVIGTGVTPSVEDLLEQAFQVAGLDWRDHVVTDAAFIRYRGGQAVRTRPRPARAIGWEPKMTFKEVVGADGRGGPERLVRRARRGPRSATRGSAARRLGPCAGF
jgi:GDPmannose 4,6-dehydratase